MVGSGVTHLLGSVFLAEFENNKLHEGLHSCRSGMQRACLTLTTQAGVGGEKEHAHAILLSL